MVSGDSIVQAQPDTAVISIAVVTQAKQAIDAQQQNATKSDADDASIKAGGRSWSRGQDQWLQLAAAASLQRKGNRQRLQVMKHVTALPSLSPT